MKKLTYILFSTIITVFFACQSNDVKVTYETDKKDTATRLGSAQVYILKKSTENSDFDYSKLDHIDDYDTKNIIKAFEPVAGQFKYYKFLSTFFGEGFNYDGPPLFTDVHDILIIKTDAYNQIIDAYQYTLEWGELPLQYDVFKSTSKNVTLTNNLDITKLKLTRTYGWSDDNKEMTDSGIIKLK